jgi:hypothetical protein
MEDISWLRLARQVFSGDPIDSLMETSSLFDEMIHWIFPNEVGQIAFHTFEQLRDI